MHRRHLLSRLALLPLLAAPTVLRAQTFALAPQFAPTEMRVNPELLLGSLIVISAEFHLYHIIGRGRAIRYGVAVGRPGLTYRGEAVVGRKAEWPSWKPTPQMIARNPVRYGPFADGLPGGPDNPLGARALYLYRDGVDTAIRIHGTNEPDSIGSAVSNGCIRMINEHVITLYDAVPLGTPVLVY
jgi:lipoprotein-anchoring transpeptidase ErfK/SrfK